MKKEKLKIAIELEDRDITVALIYDGKIIDSDTISLDERSDGKIASYCKDDHFA